MLGVAASAGPEASTETKKPKANLGDANFIDLALFLLAVERLLE
jgi:hypothetical protein